MVLSIVTRDKNDKNDKNEIKKQVIYLYVCYPPGLEDYSSRPGIVSRSSVVLSVEGVLSVDDKCLSSISFLSHFYTKKCKCHNNTPSHHRGVLLICLKISERVLTTST